MDSLGRWNILWFFLFCVGINLLNHLTRIKVARLAELLATDLDLPWAALAKRHSQRLGGGKRWIAVAKSGERLDLRRS